MLLGVLNISIRALERVLDSGEAALEAATLNAPRTTMPGSRFGCAAMTRRRSWSSEAPCRREEKTWASTKSGFLTKAS